MKKRKTIYNDFVELVFEGRNKNYGAYYLRRHENRYILTGFLITCGAILLTIFFPFILSLFEPAIPPYKPVDEEVFMQQISLPKGAITPDFVPPPPPPPKKDLPPLVVKTPDQEIKQEDTKKQEQVLNSDKKSKDSLQNKPSTGDPNSNIQGLTVDIDQRPTLTTPPYHNFQEYISANLKVPEGESIRRSSGRVIVTVCFNAEGIIISSKVSQRLNPALDAEALRVVNAMPRVNPARSHGKAVPIFVKIPVDFGPGPTGIAKGR